MGYHTTIKEMPEDMRPREKMLKQGEQFLNDDELLAILLGSGTSSLSATELAHQLIVQNRDIRFIKKMSLAELQDVKGIGPAKATRLKAATELGRRINLDFDPTPQISSPEDVKNLVMEEMRFYDKEHFRCLYLNRKNRVLALETISVGGLASSPVHPREVFKSAIKMSAASLILIHNHPSGDPTPSSEDIDITRRLLESGKILGIEVLDHIIIGDGNYVSLKNRNII
ncbi:MAG: RadC family protein [Chitinophagales bacterium]